MGNPVPLCQVLPPSLLDMLDSVGLGSTVQSLHIGNPFTPSALHRAFPLQFEEWVTQKGGVLSLGSSFGDGLGAATTAGVVHSTHTHVMGAALFQPCFGGLGVNQFPPVLRQGVIVIQPCWVRLNFCQFLLVCRI